MGENGKRSYSGRGRSTIGENQGEVQHFGYSTVALTPRESLIEALTLATTTENAVAIVDALDAYLAEPEIAARAPALVDETPRPEIVIARIEAEKESAVAKISGERDDALARAVKAEEELARLRAQSS